MIDNEDPHPFALIIELSHFSRSDAATLAREVELISQGLLGPEGERWEFQPARNDMAICFQRKSDLYRLGDRLADLGRCDLFEGEQIIDPSVPCLEGDKEAPKTSH
jgi:hypothetical protein